jgi:DNA-binding NtrC family response regulator
VTAPGDRTIDRKNNKNTVVLIEPDFSVRDALTVLLNGEGWRVRSLDDCGELLAFIRDESVFAVISESTLPGCTPHEVLEACAGLDLPVVFTGHDQSLQSAVDLIRQGALDFLDKPFPQARLLDLLEGLQERQKDQVT